MAKGKRTSAGIYTAQRAFFRDAYRTGVHGWPTEEPTKAILGFLRRPTDRVSQHTQVFSPSAWGTAHLVREWDKKVRTRTWVIPLAVYLGLGVTAVVLARAGVGTANPLFRDLAPLGIVCVAVLLPN